MPVPPSIVPMACRCKQDAPTLHLGSDLDSGSGVAFCSICGEVTLLRPLLDLLENQTSRVIRATIARERGE